MKRILVADLIESDEAGFACSKTRLVESGLPHLRPFNIGSDGALDLSEVYQVDPTEAPKGRAQLLAGDILFNNTNSAELVGKSAVVTAPMTAGFSNHLTRVRVDRSRVDPFWLSFWLRKLQASGYFTANATQWVSQAAYRTSDLGKLPIDLPSIAKQRAAVDLLSRAQGIVRLRRQAQQKAAEMIPALFVNMFGDPATNPKGWPMRSVREMVARFEGGKNLQAASEGSTDYRILKVSAVTSGEYVEAESKPTPDDYEPPPNHIVREGDMLFSRANTEQLVGATAVVRSTNGTTLLPDKLWRFVWAERVEQAFMHALFQSAHVRQELGKLSSGTSASMRNISQAKLFELRLPVPPLSQQSFFARHAEAMLSIQSQQALALQRAIATFDALLARAFSAERAADAVHEAEGAVA